MWVPSLDGRSPVRYLAIVEALADAIAAGDLRPGERLPTHRDLAWRLGLNVSTVTQAYREAARRHLVSGEVGRGTYVLAASREAALFGLRAVTAEDGAPIDLSTNVPAVDPEAADLAATLAAVAAEGRVDAALAYHSPALLRRAGIAGAAWLAARGLHLRPADVVPCAGAQAALTAVLVQLCAPGEPVLVEDLAFPGLKAAARWLRLPLHGVAMDGEGVLPEALDRAVRATGARVAVLVPNLQNPTGAVMGPARQAEVADVVRRHGLWLVEDDVYGALTGRPPLAALVPERGVLVTSLSKTVASGLRFALIAGACAPVRELAGQIHATSWPMAPLLAEVACRWIEDGTAARRLAWQRAEIAARHAQARRALPGLVAPESGPGAQPASPHLWLPRDGDADALAARCRAAGVEVVAGDLFAVTREAPQGLRLSLAAASSRAELAEALARLGHVLGGQNGSKESLSVSRSENTVPSS
ncbi:PLP-dependent aminotransferase family protein [Inquilinus limosus]|uniref:GntR family transcriptional regulator n=1 Tax=Inquilinus limosus TaxID=171674 RepID=A0A211ZQW2_9PROT|nr:PLP-dependent aminotransferase family protein [Inquilinus limosus]OWJ67487.1 GntR family transcriptional regulator [Inquilinus limosus]